MKKTLILMLLCGVASADVLIPAHCTIFLESNSRSDSFRTAKQIEICEEDKVSCIDALERMRIGFDDSSDEYKIYGVILNKVTAIDCNKKRK